MYNVEEHVQKLINYYGFAVIGVFDDKGQADNALYTVGLSNILGYELMVVTPGRIESAHILLNDLVKSLKNKNEPELVTHADAVLSDGSLLRAKIEDITHIKEAHDIVTMRSCEVTKIMQFVLADSKNLLPGEDGHDPVWSQNLLKRYC